MKDKLDTMLDNNLPKLATEVELVLPDLNLPTL